MLPDNNSISVPINIILIPKGRLVVLNKSNIAFECRTNNTTIFIYIIVLKEAVMLRNEHDRF